MIFGPLVTFPDLPFPLNLLFSNRLYWITKRAGEKQGSGLMKANAWHHRADAISSVVALIGVGKEIWFLYITFIHTLNVHVSFGSLWS